MAIKPSSHIDWTDGDAAKQEEPTVPKKLLGWIADERPSFKFMNFLFFRQDEWVKYLEEITDQLLAAGTNFDAVVGAGPGTFATINDAVAAVSAGARILVSLPQLLTATQIINKDDIEITFVPNAVLNQPGNLVLGLRIDAERVRIIRPRFTDWDDDPGNIPLEFTVNAKNCLLDGAFFFNIANANPINDLGLNNTISNAIEEQA